MRGISAISLSELVDVSPQAIYGYENDRTSPSPDVLTRLATSLNVPQPFLLLPDRVTTSETVFFRSMSSATKGARKRSQHRFTWLQDIARYVGEFVETPSSNFPSLDVPSDPLLLSDDEIEVAAEDLRRYWQMGEGPVANMLLLLENQGAIVARDKLGAETLDGLSAFVAEEQRPYVLIGTDKGSAARWRFDAAHELGHLILHANVAPETLAKPDQFKRIEQQAHRFAAAFLLPLASFGEDLFGLSMDAFRSLKPKWNVSIAMMIMRAKHAGFVSEEMERKLWINYSRRKWRKNEPLDDTTEPERPRALRKSFELMLDDGAQTSADVAARLALPTADIETLSGLPRGYLSDHSRVTLLSRPRAPSPATEEVSPTATPAEVIDLRPRRRTE